MKHLTSIVCLKLYFIAFLAASTFLMFLYSCGSARYKTTYGHHHASEINQNYHNSINPGW